MSVENWSGFNYITVLVELFTEDALNYVIVAHYCDFLVGFVVVS